jgi:hypothetical protein
MISSIISRTSALLLAVGGLALLFASDVILPMLSPDVLPGAAWVGQLIAAGWLASALYNWNSRDTLLGGIYGRPNVLLNLMLYGISALGMIKAPHAMPARLALVIVFAVMAIVYGVVLLRGPLDRMPRND